MKKQINIISIFPPWNLISLIYEQSIKIYDKNKYSIIQYIKDICKDENDYILVHNKRWQ